MGERGYLKIKKIRNGRSKKICKFGLKIFFFSIILYIYIYIKKVFIYLLKEVYEYVFMELVMWWLYVFLFFKR